ncbi:MAG: DEAD/DEAH box helicase [Acidimicrobiales bacterium]
MASGTDDGAGDRAPGWRGPVTFVPSDPPRSSVLARWSPDGASGMFAVASAGERVMVVRRGEQLRREDVACDDIDMAVAVAELLEPTADHSPSAEVWATATRLALDLVARGHVIPAVTASGWDAWQIDPLEPADHAFIEALAASAPPEAHALAAPGGGSTVADPAWLVRCFLDAVADTVMRTAAAPRALGSHVFAATEPSPAEPMRPWIAAAFGHLTSATRLGLRVEVVPAAGDAVTDCDDDADSDRTADAPADFEVVVQLRSTQDPSLVIDAAALGDCPAAVAARFGGAAGAELLVGLARAARLWPALDVLLDADSSHGRVPVSIDDLDELLDLAADLEATGVEVLWPSSFVADLRPRLVATAPPPAVATSPAVGLGVILDFRWEVLLDGEVLSDAEFEALADAKRGLVWLRDRWVRTDEQLLRRLRRLPAGLDGAPGLAAALAGEAVDEDGIAVEVVAEGFVEMLRSRLGDLAGTRDEPEPAGLAAELRPYQRRGVAWMVDLCRAGLGGVLADDMGLGKTLQVIALHLALREQGSGAPMLVVCPTSVLGNWAREIARFAPGVPVRTLAGPDRHLRDVAPDEIVLATYGVMRRMVDDLGEVPWGVVVADEAQHVKNPRSRTARSLRGVPAAARIALTGTPVENRLSELWALLDWTTPGLLGSFEHFRTEFAVPIERRGDRERSTRLGLLTKAFMLRRRKTDPGVADDLPARTQHDVVVPLAHEQLSLYEALVRESLSQIDGTEGATRVGMVFRLLTGLKQIANHPAHFLHEPDGPLDGRSGKLDATVDLVGSAVDGDERVLVFSQYVAMCQLLRRRFGEAGIEAEVLHGGLSSAARDRLVERFQAGDIPVLVISLKAGGTGLNLTAATQVVHFDRWWNPAVEDQATDRAWRMGQTKPVVVHRMIAEGTIDERIAEMIERKRSLADTVSAGGEAWIADLDDAELRELVSLRAGAPLFRSGVMV